MQYYLLAHHFRGYALDDPAGGCPASVEFAASVEDAIAQGVHDPKIFLYAVKRIPQDSLGRLLRKRAVTIRTYTEETSPS